MIPLRIDQFAAYTNIRETSKMGKDKQKKNSENKMPQKNIREKSIPSLASLGTSLIGGLPVMQPIVSTLASEAQASRL